LRVGLVGKPQRPWSGSLSNSTRGLTIANQSSNRIRMASRELEQRGFLLSEDATVIVHAAAESRAFK